VKAAARHGAGASGVIETKGGRAERLLMEVLATAGGSLLARELDAALEKLEVAPKQIELAKRALGNRGTKEITWKKTKKGVVWSLVNPPAEEGKEGAAA